jgi:carboxymethylenebutenolidase
MGFAAQGYWVIAPSTFSRVKAGVELGYTTEDIALGFEWKTAVETLPAPGVMSDIQAAAALARERSLAFLAQHIG